MKIITMLKDEMRVKKIIVAFLLHLMSCLLISLASSNALAQSQWEGPNGNGVGGIITAVNGTTIELLNGIFLIDASNAKLISPGFSNKLALASLTPGMRVRVMIADPNSNPLQAKAIIIPPEENGIIRGNLQSISGNTITLLGHQILVSSKTRFGKGIQNLSDLKEGQVIVVSIANLGSQVTAIEICLPTEKIKQRESAEREIGSFMFPTNSD